MFQINFSFQHLLESTNTMIKFQGCIQSPVKHIKWNISLKAVGFFPKTIHLRYLTKFWTYLWIFAHRMLITCICAMVFPVVFTIMDIYVIAFSTFNYHHIYIRTNVLNVFSQKSIWVNIFLVDSQDIFSVITFWSVIKISPASITCIYLA